MQFHAITLPSSSRRERRRLYSICHELRRRVGHRLTLSIVASRCDVMHAAREAAERGCDRVIAIGGTPTIIDVVNGLMNCLPEVRESCAVGIITEQPRARLADGLRIPHALDEQLETVIDGRPRPLDLGRVRFTKSGSDESQLYFVHECQFSVDPSLSRWDQTREPRGHSIRLALDDQPAPECRTQRVSIRLASLARSEGSFRVELFQPQTGAVKLLYGLGSRRFLRCAPDTKFDARLVELIDPGRYVVTADGQLVGSCPCRVEIVPKALRVIKPPLE